MTIATADWIFVEAPSAEALSRLHNEKALRETQTLRAGCSKWEPKNSPCLRPFPGAQDSQNLISWRWSLPLPKYPVW